MQATTGQSMQEEKCKSRLKCQDADLRGQRVKTVYVGEAQDDFVNCEMLNIIAENIIDVQTHLCQITLDPNTHIQATSLWFVCCSGVSQYSRTNTKLLNPSTSTSYCSTSTSQS